jgi:hypothetical protein
MKLESRRRKAEGDGQDIFRSLPIACCLPLAAFYFLPRLHVSLSSSGRALLVAALLVSAYALVRYWQSLDKRAGTIRYALVSLRALTLLLLACALAGVRAEYQDAARARVLLRSVSGVEESRNTETNGTGNQDHARQQMIAVLRAKGFEIVEANNEESAQSVQPDGSFVAGVLLTDGAISAAEASREVERMRRGGGDAPVFAVTNYPASGVPSVALERVTVLAQAVRGVPIAVRLLIHARGMRGRESLVTISDEAKVQVGARVGWTSDDERQAVVISVVPKVAGWIDYDAKVEAANGEDSAYLSRPFTVYAEERRLRVLFFESEPTWEAKFIRRALEQSGLFEVDYLAQVSRAATVGVSEEAGGESDPETGTEPQVVSGRKKRSGAGATPEVKLHAALQSAAQLGAYDCVIVGATENKLLSSAESARLREWVERRGGGLIVLGGNSFNGSIATPGGKLYSLLPTEIGAPQLAAEGQDVSRGRPLEAEKMRAEGLLTPTEAGASGALAGYLSANEAAAAKRAALTGQGLRLGQLRPGGAVLAVAGEASGANGTSETGASQIAAMRYGAGRTLLFAPADSWRIRTSENNNQESTGGAFNALWQGLVLWTAAGARPVAGIVLSDESPAEGGTVTAEIRASDVSFAPLKIEKMNARLQPLSEDTSDGSQSTAQPREIGFAPDPLDESVWRARFTSPQRGRYVLETEYAAGGKSAMIEKYFAVVTSSPREAGSSLDTLNRISRESGGEAISAADTNTLVERLAAIPINAGSVHRTWELRTWWPLAFIIPLLLSLEWFARRWWKVD